jgi:hypothetical protein
MPICFCFTSKCSDWGSNLITRNCSWGSLINDKWHLLETVPLLGVVSKRSDQAGIGSWTKSARRYDRSSSFAVLGEVRDLLDFVRVILYVCQDLCKHVPDCALRFHAMSSQERSQLTESLVFSDAPPLCFHFRFRTFGVLTLWLRDTCEARLGSPQRSRLSTYRCRVTNVCLISRRHTQIMVSLSGGNCKSISGWTGTAESSSVNGKAVDSTISVENEVGEDVCW